MKRPLLCAKPVILPRAAPKWGGQRHHALMDLIQKVTRVDVRLHDVTHRALNRLLPPKPLTPQKPNAQLGSRIAIYTHYNPTERVSAMVFAQLDALRGQGFDVLFVSMSRVPNLDDLNRLSEVTFLSMTRRSFGRDFGAVNHVWMNFRESLLAGTEILLVNDSVVGPIFPLDPIFEAMRRHGDGVFGLTDSPDYFPHLQSYFLLFRGSAAISALNQFFGDFKATFSKRNTIKRGELGLSKYLYRQKVPLWALFSYEDLERLLLEDLSEMEKLVVTLELPVREHMPNSSDDEVRMRQLRYTISSQLMKSRLNPSHFFWRILLEKCGYPFIKTELLIFNPARICDLRDWQTFVGPKSPVRVIEIEEHLRMMATPNIGT